jgi:ankyrin repeat protein
MGTSALIVAIHGGHGDFAAFLLDQGADANDDRAGYTALHLAAVRGDLDLIKALLAHGANPNPRQAKASPTSRIKSNHALDKTTIGATPFLLATRVAELDTMRLLAANRADVAATLDDGTTAIMALELPTTTQALKISEERIVETITQAIKLGAHVNGANRDGDTALHIAARRRLDTVVQLLADNGAELNARNKSGDTPLAVALKPPPTPHGAGQNVITLQESLVAHTATAELLRKLGATE